MKIYKISIVFQEKWKVTLEISNCKISWSCLKGLKNVKTLQTGPISESDNAFTTGGKRMIRPTSSEF